MKIPSHFHSSQIIDSLESNDDFTRVNKAIHSSHPKHPPEWEEKDTHLYPFHENFVELTLNILTYIDIINRAHSRRTVFIVTPERCGMIFNHVDDLSVDLILFDEAQLGDDLSVRGLFYDGLVRRCHRSFPDAKLIFAHPFIANPDAQIIKIIFHNNKPRAKYICLRILVRCSYCTIKTQINITILV